MKKLAALMMTVLFALAILAGCGGSPDGNGSGEASGQSVDAAKTLADVAQYESYGYSYSEDKYIGVFADNGVYYRVIADIPEDVSAELDALDWGDADHDQKVAELLAPLEIASIENLSDQLISQEELDKLVGKTGQDLLDSGWIANGGYDADSSVVFMEYGPFQYSFTFDGAIKDAEDLIIEDAIKSLPVKSAEYLNLSSDAVNMNE